MKGKKLSSIAAIDDTLYAEWVMGRASLRSKPRNANGRRPRVNCSNIIPKKLAEVIFRVYSGNFLTRNPRVEFYDNTHWSTQF